MMEEIRRALMEEEAAQSIYGGTSGSCGSGAGSGSAVSFSREGLMSTLNSVASSIFPSMRTGAGMSRKWSSSTGGSGSGSGSGVWGEEEEEREREEEEDEGEMGEMLLSLSLPPMTLPSSKRNGAGSEEMEVGAGEIRRRGP